MVRISILLVDDHPIVRAGVRRLIETARDCEVVGEASDGVEALRLAQCLQPDVMLLDMQMPGMDGYQVARQVVESGLPVQILALSAHKDWYYVQALLESSISGYLTKDEAPDEILNAIRGVARGERGWVSDRAAATLLQLQKRADENRQLTGREIEIMDALVCGKTNREIGATLGISERTVEKHLQEIYSRMGVFSRVEAAVEFLRLNGETGSND